MSDKKPSLALDASWLMLAKTVAFSVTFALPLVLVRHLSQVDFGLYRQFFLLVNTAMTVLPFGFVMSAFYFLPRAGNRRGSVALNIVVVYAVIASIAGGVLMLRPSVLAAIFDNPGMTAYARPLAVVLFLSVVSSFVDLLALANGDVKAAATFVVVTNLAKTILLAAAAMMFESVGAILVASMLHGLLQLILLFAYLKLRFQSFAGGVDLEVLRKQIAYAIPLGLASWLYWLQMESHHYFVARAFGPASYAIYAIGCVGLPLITMFAESIAGVLIHRVSWLHSQNRRDDIVALLSEAMRSLAAVYFPIYALLLVTGRDLIAIVYTPRFLASWPIFAINLTLLPLGILSVVNDAAIRSYKECQAFLVGVRLVLVAVLLSTLWFVTPRYGPVAVISIVVAVNGLERVILTGRIAKALHLRWRDAVILKAPLDSIATAFAAGIGAFAIRLAFPRLGYISGLLVSVVAFLTIYFAANYVRARGTRDPGVAIWSAILPEPGQQVISALLARTRDARASVEAGKEAA